MKTDVRIHKNFATNKTEIRIIRYNGDNVEYFNHGAWVLLHENMEIPIVASISMNSEIITDETEREIKSESDKLVQQKHDDKECHIQNLNEILFRVMDSK